MLAQFAHSHQHSNVPTHSQPELLAIGETMALITPNAAEPLAIAREMHLAVGGAESNVAAHVAQLGHHAAWAGRLGADPLGDRVLAELSARDIDVSWVVRDPHAPTGLYLKDPGNGVHYYRSGSAASHMSPTHLDRLPLDEARIVHVSGITAALSDDCDAMLDDLFARVSEYRTLLSFDVNHRVPLWSAATAAGRLRELAAHADLVFVGLDEARTLWGTSTARDVRALLPEPRQLVVKDADVGATEFSRTDRGEAEPVFVPAERVEVVEAIGAGDAFAGGYLAALLEAAPAHERLAAGHRRAALILRGTTDMPDTPAREPATPSAPAPTPSHPASRVPANGNGAFDEIFAGSPVMALFRGLGTARSLELAQQAWRLGIDVVELPIQSDDDVAALAAVVRAGEAQGKLVGAGTVLTLEDVERAASAGAAFTVSPGFDPEIVRASIAAGMPPLPGVATPSEVQAALALGLTWVKAFPASVLGAAWFRAMRGPFPQVRFVATGGIDATNAADFLAAGVRTVAVGSALEDETQLPALAALIER